MRDVLIFFTGASNIPPIGFKEVLSLYFLYPFSAKLPTASTCDMTLRIPTSHDEYSVFKEYMILGIKGNDGFRVV